VATRVRNFSERLSPRHAAYVLFGLAKYTSEAGKALYVERKQTDGVALRALVDKFLKGEIEWAEVIPQERQSASTTPAAEPDLPKAVYPNVDPDENEGSVAASSSDTAKPFDHADPANQSGDEPATEFDLITVDPADPLEEFDDDWFVDSCSRIASIIDS
jgi:hypothetical protein